MKIFGIPLHVWEEGFFKLLGDKFGMFLDFHELTVSRNRLDVAQILVSTARMGFIDEHLRISVMGEVYTLWVVEDVVAGGLEEKDVCKEWGGGDSVEFENMEREEDSEVAFSGDDSGDGDPRDGEDRVKKGMGCPRWAQSVHLEDKKASTRLKERLSQAASK